MTPNYIYDAPPEALEALDKYHEIIFGIDEPDIDWMAYPFIFALTEWHMDFNKLSKDLEKIELENKE